MGLSLCISPGHFSRQCNYQRPKISNQQLRLGDLIVERFRDALFEHRLQHTIGIICSFQP